MYHRQTTDLFAAFRFAADIQPERQQWLWPARIPIGCLTLLVGDPGVGKSLLVADLAGRGSRPSPARSSLRVTTCVPTGRIAFGLIDSPLATGEAAP